MDTKGRVALPPDFRKALVGPQGERLLLTKFRARDRHSVDAWPEPTFHEFEAQVLQKSQGNPKMGKIRDVYLGAATCEVDGQGRILIPQPLRDFARLEKDVVFVGRGNMFRIWRQDVWEQVEREALEIFDDEATMNELGLT